MFVVGLLPFVALLARFERGGAAERPWVPWRLIAGAALTCAGLALNGVNTASPPSLRIVPLPLLFIGVELAGFGIIAMLASRFDDARPR